MSGDRTRWARRLLLAGTLAVSLSACGGDATDDEPEAGEGVIEEGSGVDDLVDS